MLIPFAITGVLALAGVPDSVALAAPGDATWTVIAAYDEVQLAVDAARLARAEGAPAPGVVRARVRWTLRSPEVSPDAWAHGARTTVDAVDVDCVSGSTRTLESRAFAGDGTPVPVASFAVSDGTWRRHAAASVGAQLAAGVCRLAARAR